MFLRSRKGRAARLLSSDQLEPALAQRIREDLGFRYLTGEQQPGHWALNEFRRKHPLALNSVFTQVLEYL